MTPETRVKNDVMKYLKELEKTGHPIYIERRQAGGSTYRKGLPDIYIIYDGIHIEIEIKKPGGCLSVLQEQKRDMFKKINTKWIVIESVNELKDFMRDTFLI